MGEQRIHAYLLLIDPSSLAVVWANDNVERVMAARGAGTAVGRQVPEVIPFAEALGVDDRLREVAETGEMREIHTAGVSLQGEQTTTAASMYRLPSGEILMATEYAVSGVLW